MEKPYALRILNALANGVHPATGEKFAADSPYQHPDTVRALNEAVRTLEAQPLRYPKQKPRLTVGGLALFLQQFPAGAAVTLDVHEEFITLESLDEVYHDADAPYIDGAVMFRPSMR